MTHPHAPVASVSRMLGRVQTARLQEIRSIAAASICVAASQDRPESLLVCRQMPAMLPPISSSVDIANLRRRAALGLTACHETNSGSHLKPTLGWPRSHSAADRTWPVCSDVCSVDRSTSWPESSLAKDANASWLECDCDATANKQSDWQSHWQSDWQSDCAEDVGNKHDNDRRHAAEVGVKPRRFAPHNTGPITGRGECGVLLFVREPTAYCPSGHDG
jgi:hypothetical protein